jgi:lysozyme
VDPTCLALLIAELRFDEGVRYVQYPDTKGIPTTGVGHNLQASPLPAGWTFPLTDDQVNQLLSSDLQFVFNGLTNSIPWWLFLDDVRQRVLCNMAFNMGVHDLLGFSKMLNAVETGNFVAAAADMKASDWYGEVGDRAVRLCSAMSTGVMPEPPGTAVAAIPSTP